jgi:hypothetical protein
MEDLTYEQTIELEKNIKLKNEANSIYQNFLTNVKLNVSEYKEDGKFRHTYDSYNSTYFQLKGNTFYYICDFLHENYIVTVTPSGIFAALQQKNRGVEHLSHEVMCCD